MEEIDRENNIEATGVNSTKTKYDPWPPISAALFSTKDSDLVQTLIEFGGLAIALPVFDPEPQGNSNKTRLRLIRPLVQAAYSNLPDEEKGLFAQTVAKRLWESGITESLKYRTRDSLNALGWTIAEDGALTTQDVLLSEQFFPAGSTFDAYVAIRSIIEQASERLLIVDAYIGSTVFAILRATSRAPLAVDVLTVDEYIKPDFEAEAQAFQRQFPGVQLDVRTTPAFHDRFIVLDGSEYYHVGASIKDAGKRAFLMSRLQDRRVIDLLKQYIDSAWMAAVKKPY